MKYYKGYPEEMKVDGQAVTLHDIERTMLSLCWDKTLCEGDKDHLMDQYKEERMRYLDSIYQPTEAGRLRLKEVERLFTNAKERMENVCQRIIKTELQKREQGEKAAHELSLHLEVWNLEETEDICYSDEESDLWDVLFGEEREYFPYWGLMSNHVYISEGELKEYRHPKRYDTTTDEEEEPLSQLKKAYKLGWQDILKITRFYLTVNLEY